MRRASRRANAGFAAKDVRWLSLLGAAAALSLLIWIWWRGGHQPTADAPATQAPPRATNQSIAAASPATNLVPSSRPKAELSNLFTTINPEIRMERRPALVVSARQPTNEPPPAVVDTNEWLRILDAQVALTRKGCSVGPLDSVLGGQTHAALRAFQLKEGLPVTGSLDDLPRARLTLAQSALTRYTVTSNDLARLLPVGRTWLARSQQERLDYESILELVSEKGWSSPKLIRRLNPEIDWENVRPGREVVLPTVEYAPASQKAALVRIYLSQRALQVFDAQSNLVVHFPCSIAKLAEKRPVGELKVAVVVPNPNYTFNPEVFPESPEARELGRKLIVPPGPNNPVGTVWIGLDKPGYGIHGTPQPEQVGRTESHGCFRLANWNAEYLLKLVAVGLPVSVEP